MFLADTSAADVASNNANRHFQYLIEHAERTGEPFFAIIVDVHSGKILADGAYENSFDITAHSEINAVRAFLHKYPGRTLNDVVMYTTAEPCPMCAAALIWAGIRHVVFGITRPELYDLGWHTFRMRAASLVHDAKKADGYVGQMISYQGPKRLACIALFKNYRGPRYPHDDNN